MMIDKTSTIIFSSIGLDATTPTTSTSTSTSTSSKRDYVPSKIEKYVTDNRKKNIATTSKYLDVPRVNAPSNNNNNAFVVVDD